MKIKFSIFILALIAITTFSCKDDVVVVDPVDPLAENKAKILGTWAVDTEVYTNCDDADDNESYTFNYYGYSCEETDGGTVCDKYTVTFSESGTATLVFYVESTDPDDPSGMETLTGTWEILDLTRIQTCFNGDCETDTYVVTDTNLTLNSTVGDEDGCDETSTFTKETSTPDPLGDISTNIVGTWDINTFIDSDCNDPEDNQSLIFNTNGQACEDIQGFMVCVDMTVTFMASGTLTSEFIVSVDGVVDEDESGTSTGTWEILDLNRIRVCEDGDCSDDTYTITGTDLTINSSDDEDGCNTVTTATKQ